LQPTNAPSPSPAPPLRILQLNSARKYIGEAAHTLNLAEALRRHGHAVWLGLRRGYDTLERAAARGLEPLAFNMPHRWWPPQDGPDLAQIARLVKSHGIQLVHTHRGKDHWQAVLAARLYRLKIPVVRTRHVVTPWSSNPANRWLARRTARLVVVSRAVETDVTRVKLFTPERVAFIPGGIDLELFAPAGENVKRAARAALMKECGIAHDDSGPLAFCVARFAVVKAHRVLLDAWKILLAQLPAARLVLVGDGLLFEENKVYARALGIAERVLFLGRRLDVATLLNAADCGVLSSIGSEGFSRAVLEYMSKGLPVAATRVGAVPDLVDDGVHGKLAAPNDAEALAAALLQVLAASTAQRETWGRAARQKAVEHYGYDGWARAHERLYAEILGT
jgi:glycosyltransferase involved in cell wall biosynthesis